jgi:hypothetical protein
LIAYPVYSVFWKKRDASPVFVLVSDNKLIGADFDAHPLKQVRENSGLPQYRRQLFVPFTAFRNNFRPLGINLAGTVKEFLF